MGFKFYTAARAAAVLGLTTALVSLGTVAATAPSASADPVYTSALVGVGSNTTQDLFNALAGAAPFPASTTPVQASKYFTAIHSSDSTGDVGIVSWDAVDPGTLAPGCLLNGAKPGSAEIDRPNGSGSGQNALSDANDGDAWAPTTNCSQNSTSSGDATGQIDFSRSSSGPSSAHPGTNLTFVPFARDGVGYAYYAPAQADHGAADAGALSNAQLQALFGTGNTASGGVLTLGNGDKIFACMMQAGSGTGQFWDGAMGNNGTGATSDTSAVNSGCGDTLEENGGSSFVTSTFVSSLTATEVAVIPFSAGSWIAQANLVARDRSATARTDGANLGNIDGLGVPYTGSPGSEAPNNTFYASTVYGRDLYVVLPTIKLGGPAGSNGALKSLFTNLEPSPNNVAVICQSAAQTTINMFGFTGNLPAGQTCGMTGNAAFQSGYTQ